MKSFYRVYVFLLIFCGLILLAVTFREDINISDNVKSIPPVPEEITSTFKLYFMDTDKLVVENRTVTTKDMEFEEVIIKELIKGPRNKTLLATIPQETKLLSLETIDEICYVNFSKEYKQNKNYEYIKEDLIIWSIVNSLTQLDYVKKVQILVEGEKIEIEHSDYSLEQPFSRNEDIIKKSRVTYFSYVQNFLDSIVMERYDKAYSMIDKTSTIRIGFQEFRVLMDEYIKELRGYEIVLYNTQKFSDKIIVQLKYKKSSKHNEITFYQEWKLINVDGQIKIVLGDKEDYISRLNLY